AEVADRAIVPARALQEHPAVIERALVVRLLLQDAVERADEIVEVRRRLALTERRRIAALLRLNPREQREVIGLLGVGFDGATRFSISSRFPGSPGFGAVDGDADGLIEGEGRGCGTAASRSGSPVVARFGALGRSETLGGSAVRERATGRARCGAAGGGSETT